MTRLTPQKPKRPNPQIDTMEIEQSEQSDDDQANTAKAQETQPPTPANSVNQHFHWPAGLSIPKTVKYVLKPEKVEVLKKMSTYVEWKQAFVAYAAELGKEDKFGNVLAHSRCIKEQVFKTIELQVGKGNIHRGDVNPLKPFRHFLFQWRF